MTAVGRRRFLRLAGWTAAPFAAAVLVASTVASYAPDPSILVMVLFALVGLGLVAVLPVALVFAIQDRQWPDIASVAAGLILAAWLVVPVWWAGDYVHLATAYVSHADEFRRADGHPVSVPWNSNGFAGSHCETSLVYDPAGLGGQVPGVVRLRLTRRFFTHMDCE